MSFSSNFGRAIDLANASIKSKTKFAGLETDIGSLSNLATTNKSSLVAAVNELKSMVAALAPVITSGQSISGNTAASVNYTVTGSNITVSGNIKRVSWSASSLPSGLSIDASTGVITGTVTTAGTYNFAVSVTTNIGTATENVTAVIEMHSYPPSVDSGSFSCNMTQELVRYIPAGTNTELDSSKGITSVQWSASNLPSGLSINSSTGNITGTPPTAGTWNATVTCTTNYGSASNTITITVNKYYPPTISLSSFDANMTQSVSGVYGSGTNVDIDSSKGITSVQWSASGLPSGLSINSSTGQITGTASSPGTWTATITCTTNYGTVSKAVTVTINKYYPPSITPDQVFECYKNGSFLYNYKGFMPSIEGSNLWVDSSKGITYTTWSITNLPSGLSYSTTDWSIWGNSTDSLGTKYMTVKCTNNYGTASITVKFRTRNPAYPPSPQSLQYNVKRGQSVNLSLDYGSRYCSIDSSKDIKYVNAYISSGRLPTGLSLTYSNGHTGSGSYPRFSGTVSSSALLGTYEVIAVVETNQGWASCVTTIVVAAS